MILTAAEGCPSSGAITKLTLTVLPPLLVSLAYCGDRVLCCATRRCPLAAPTGAALQSTMRGSRYWRLRSAVAAAVHRAGGGDLEAASAQQEAEPSSLPSKLQVRACALPSAFFSSASGAQGLKTNQLAVSQRVRGWPMQGC